MIPLGSEVRDTVTGFQGIAIGRTQWLTGCATIVVKPKVNKDGQMMESQTIGEPSLEVMKSEKLPSGGITGG